MCIFLTISLYHIDCPLKTTCNQLLPYNAVMNERSIPHVQLCLYCECDQHYKSLVIQVIPLIQDSINNTLKIVIKEQPSQYRLLCPGSVFIYPYPSGSWSTTVLKNGIEKVSDKSCDILRTALGEDVHGGIFFLISLVVHFVVSLFLHLCLLPAEV